MSIDGVEVANLKLNALFLPIKEWKRRQQVLISATSLVKSLRRFMNLGGRTSDWPMYYGSLIEKLQLDIKISYDTLNVLH